MLGTPDSVNTLGIIPSAISWLFRGIHEQKQKTGARFSVRVSAVEVCQPTQQLKDLLAGHANASAPEIPDSSRTIPEIVFLSGRKRKNFLQEISYSPASRLI
ncbi:Kinesin-like protein kif26b [Polyplax serrata]|uniref:Kinesin-like protein kif26b n=1 Tax=Polyplax serrata TaxID=468196 RepID=A0ABR1BEB7_POLSC